MKPRKKDKKVNILIQGKELFELKRHAELMVEAFGLDRRIKNYQGKRSIGFYRWDLDCLIDVMEIALNDPDEYLEKDSLEYKALSDLHNRLKREYHSNFEQ